MDEIEKFIKDELQAAKTNIPLDIDAVIAGTHSRIRKRSIRRKTIYSSPVVILLVMMVMTLFPESGGEVHTPGSELLMASWEYTWTELEHDTLEFEQDQLLYEQTIDYLMGDYAFTYIEDSEAILDADDLEALMGFLEEA